MNIHDAIDRVKKKEPLFTALVMGLTPVESTELPTLGTDGEKLMYNQKFLDTLSDGEVSAVVLHEVLHCAFLHLWRRGKRNAELFNIACVVGDTLILMANGNTKAIKDIEKGEEVIGYQDGKLIKGKVLLTITKEDDIMETSYQNNKLISTKDHQILTQYGYKKAQDINSETMVAMVRNRQDICTTELYDHDNCRNGSTAQCGLSSGRFFSTNSQIIQKQKNQKTQKLLSQNSSNRIAVGIFGGNSGWGRNNNYSKNISIILSTIFASCQYQYQSFKNIIRLGFLWCFSHQQQRKTILEDYDIGISDNHTVRTADAISNHKKIFSKIGDGIYQNKARSKSQGKTEFENARNLSDNQEIKYTRIKNQRILGRREKVYDLITTSHSYIANNIIVHNCDYAINTIVNESFPLPKGALLDEKFKGMSAEAIYDLLMKSAKKQAGQGWCDKEGWEGKSGKGLGDKIKKALGKKPSDAQKRASMAAKWKRLFEKNILKQYGKLPDSIRRVVTKEYYVPQIDWTSLVQNLLSEDNTDYSFSTPDRRYLEDEFMLPDMASMDRLRDIVFAYDTSGSINEHQLMAFYMESLNLFSNYTSLSGYVAICDAELHSFKEISQHAGYDAFEFKGNGGTNFCPIFDEIKRRGIRPKSLFIFSDTEGSFPDYVPDYQVYWLVPSYSGGEQPSVPFGQVVPFLLK